VTIDEERGSSSSIAEPVDGGEADEVSTIRELEEQDGCYEQL